MQNAVRPSATPLCQSVAQPRSGSLSAETSDVLLHGTIGKDGGVHSIVVDRSDRPELNQEAIQTVSRQVFTPAGCDGTNREAKFRDSLARPLTSTSIRRDPDLTVAFRATILGAVRT